MLERMQRKRNTPPLLVGCQLVQPLWKSIWWLLKKMGMSLPQYPATSLLRIYPKEAHSYNKDICSTIFIAALFVIARTWKQPKLPSTEEWIEKMCYIYTMEYYSAETKQWKLEICWKMDGTWRNHSEWGNPITKRQTWYILTHMWILDVE